MEPILKTVAREYKRRYDDLKHICFLFPNKRCGIFLRKYFAEEGVHQEELPHILTISEFVMQITHLQEASKIQQLFTLYNSYKELLKDSGENEPMQKEPAVEFEEFKNWGEIVLSDFNVVDMNLVETDEIFKNVKDFREITSNFLTDDQREVMREYFGIEVPDEDNMANSFWKTFNDPSNLSFVKQKFFNLWQILSPLHDKFIETLNRAGLGTAGSIYRLAAARVNERDSFSVPYKKVVVIGFNALTEAERSIFKGLQKAPDYKGYDDFIDFIWDATGPILKDSGFTASRFVHYNRKHFPSPQWLLEALQSSEGNDYPDISIISAPSITSQAKIAGEMLGRYRSEKEKSMIADAEVALILPDESILPNMLYSFPDEIGSINLTMSYSLKQTPVASFFNLIRRLYATMREGKDGNVFFVKDLKLFFAHPYSRIFLGNDIVDGIIDFIEEKRKVSFSFSELEEKPESLTLLNFPQKGNNDYIIFDFITKILQTLTENLGEEERYLDEKAQIEIYSQYVEELRRAMEIYKIRMSPMTVLQIVDRLIGSEKIGFEGEPLYGLQVMGTLESRALDFKHVIILSLNEGIMPKKTMMSTFIPESLRKAYGLPPARYSEEIFGYYFYRLLSRAEKVTLIYDGRAVSGMRSGESRYLLQLQHYVPSEKISFQAWQYDMKNHIGGEADVEKTPEIMNMIEAYSKEGPEKKNLSASSLTTYRKCEVQFFLNNLLNIDTDPDRTEYMDSIAVGNVLHEVMMDLYLPEERRGKLLDQPVVLNEASLKTIQSNKDLIRNLVERKIKKHFYKRAENDSRVFNSQAARMVGEQIQQLVNDIIEYDRKLGVINLYGCEIKENLRIELSSGRIVNFKFAIDRLDEIEIDGVPTLRIVDYKTGSRKREADSLAQVFDEGKGDQIFQLFMYAWLLNKRGMRRSDNVTTEIYFVPDLNNNKRGLPKIGKKEVKSYSEYSEEFSKRLEELVESLFKSPTFRDKGAATTCLYCAFRSHCHKS